MKTQTPTIIMFVLAIIYSTEVTAACNCIHEVRNPLTNKKVCISLDPTCHLPGIIPDRTEFGVPFPDNAPRIEKCISNLKACPAHFMASLGYGFIKPIAEGYIRFLRAQALNRFSPIDGSLLSAIQPYYSIDLRNIRYATGINTIHGANITIGNEIYFTKPMNFGDPNDAWLLYHELEHSVQYANRGGVNALLTEYTLKAGGSILRGGSTIAMHDNIDLERAANAKANQVAGSLGRPTTPPVAVVDTVSSLESRRMCRLTWGGTENQGRDINAQRVEIYSPFSVYKEDALSECVNVATFVKASDVRMGCSAGQEEWARQRFTINPFDRGILRDWPPPFAGGDCW